MKQLLVIIVAVSRLFLAGLDGLSGRRLLAVVPLLVIAAAAVLAAAAVAAMVMAVVVAAVAIGGILIAILAGVAVLVRCAINALAGYRARQLVVRPA